jgi:hypothetical protein
MATAKSSKQKSTSAQTKAGVKAATQKASPGNRADSTQPPLGEGNPTPPLAETDPGYGIDLEDQPGVDGDYDIDVDEGAPEEELEEELTQEQEFAREYIEHLGVPEHVANQQIYDAALDKVEGDVVNCSWLPVENKIMVGVIDENGQIVNETYPATHDQYLEFEAILHGEDWQADANAAYEQLKADSGVKPDSKKAREGKPQSGLLIDPTGPRGDTPDEARAAAIANKVMNDRVKAGETEADQARERRASEPDDEEEDSKVEEADKARIKEAEEFGSPDDSSDKRSLR